MSIELKPGRPCVSSRTWSALRGPVFVVFLDGRWSSPGGSCRMTAPRGSSPYSADGAFQVTRDAMADVARIFGYLWIGESA